MAESVQCQRCGATLPVISTGGLCPNCVLRTVLDSGADSLGPAAEGFAAIPRLRYFGDYELLEEVARGGMGVVYRARQVSLDRIVAVKMMRPGVLSSPEEVRRFQTEARLAAGLRHTNIVTIYEIGEHDGLHYFSMDYVDGVSLAALVGRAPLEPRAAARCLRTIADAIDSAHRGGILHRDLKPSNVVLDAGGEPHITDFGLAKQISAEPGVALAGAVVGTPGYMSPEQAGGHSDRLTAASDVYSLGALLYELMTGIAPFRAPTPMETVKLVVGAAPAPPRTLNGNLPRDLETICLKCLEKEPQHRYASAEALADDLGRFLAGEPIRARSIGLAGRTWRWCRRNPWPTATIAAVAILGIVSAGAAVLLRRASARAAPIVASPPPVEPRAALGTPAPIPTVRLEAVTNTATPRAPTQTKEAPAPPSSEPTAPRPILGFEVTRIAGSDDLGDGGPVEKAELRLPAGIAVDSDGNIYFADSDAPEIRRIGVDNIITRVAGAQPSPEGAGGLQTHPASSPEGKQARDVPLEYPTGVALNPRHELYFTDSQRILKIDSAGKLRIVAGAAIDSSPGFAGDGGLAVGARLSQPRGLAFGPDGSLYFVDLGNRRIRRITLDGMIRTVAGNGSTGSGGDGGPAIQAPLGPVLGDMAIDRSGNLYIRDVTNCRVRRVAPDGIITTVAGTGRRGYSGDHLPAIRADLGSGSGLAVDDAGNLFVGDQYRVRKVDPNGIIVTIAGDGAPGYPSDGVAAVQSHLGSFLPHPVGDHLQVGIGGEVYLSDTFGQHLILRIDTAGILHVVAANVHIGDGGPAAAARLNLPMFPISGPNGDIYFSDMGHNRVRKVSVDGKIATVAGTGREDGPGAVPAPRGLALDSHGNLFIASGSTIRKVSSDGTLSLAAGGATPGSSGDDGPATQARLVFPTAIAFDASGNLMICDGDAIRKVSPEGMISTWLGGDKSGQTGRLSGPTGLAIDRWGNVLVSELGDSRVLSVSPSGTIATVAGTGEFSPFLPPGSIAAVRALATGLGPVHSVTADATGNIFIASFALLWVSPDGLLHRSTYTPNSLSRDRDGTLLGTEALGRLNRYTPRR